jgi:8-oxo-dGTP diphosphatase
MKPLLTRAFQLIPKDLLWRALWLANSKVTVGVAGVLFDPRGRVLLLEHVFRHAHPWGLPAGWMKTAESVEETLRRELHEEVGLRCAELRLVAVESGFRMRFETVLMGLVEGEPRVQSLEIRDAAFFDPAELPDRLLPTHREHIARAVDARARGGDAWMLVPRRPTRA